MNLSFTPHNHFGFDLNCNIFCQRRYHDSDRLIVYMCMYNPPNGEHLRWRRSFLEERSSLSNEAWSTRVLRDLEQRYFIRTVNIYTRFIKAALSILTYYRPSETRCSIKLSELRLWHSHCCNHYCCHAAT
ncbi:hypothetical protein PHET_11443 [Paragonimus heterotremus]|uniref:Uncharacterized protein n=1 Tax=Paragonimus heterotremus TaxID=100268 RepID=A0A8J4T0Z8_9TREM|nr:hypothetical protein PHET_11443 [Paragonimus heterotremus]